MKHELPVFALLIDADNDTPEVITPVIEEATRHARITVRRIYGDFTTPQLAGWREMLANHGIHPIQQYRNTVGKNASDSALIIDAMDLLHGGRLDGFCLVSSDGDFTRLATRIRENGLSVFGFGRKHAPKAFVNACERYIYVENLLNPPALPLATEVTAENASKPSKTVSQVAPSSLPGKPQSSGDKAKLKGLLLRAYTNVADDDGWALVSRIALYLRSNHSDFDPRSFGASNFVRLLQSVGCFELAERKQGNGLSQFCRPLARKLQSDYLAALHSAVETTKATDGWSGISTIRNYLREHGHSIEESGCGSLTEALLATGHFEMRDVGGGSKDFRRTPAKSQ